MLDDLDDFIAACVENASSFGGPNEGGRFPASAIYCPGCGGPRRVSISVVHTGVGRSFLSTDDLSSGAIAKQLAPALFRMVCLQDCGTFFTVLLFRGPEKYELAVFPSKRGGLALPHTPPSVAFYLDQAQRAESVDANSAAVAMYRAALEHLLFDQGFKARMLGPKLTELEKAIQEAQAPRWARDLDRRYLSVLKDLGNAAIHAGEGDVSRQQALNEELLRSVKITFVELLRLVYEEPFERKERLASLEAGLAALEGS